MPLFRKPKITTRVDVRYDLEPAHADVIRARLEGDINHAQVADRLKCSKQQAINLTAALACQWVQDGALKFTKRRSR